MYTVFVAVGNGSVKPAMMYTKPLKAVVAGPESVVGKFMPLLQLSPTVS
jgi:hypothetical protein